MYDNLIEGYSNSDNHATIEGQSVPTKTPKESNNSETGEINKNKEMVSKFLVVLNILSKENSSDIYINYESEILNFNSIVELGNPKNSNILNFVETLLIKFINLNDNQVNELLNSYNYCDPSYSMGAPKNDIIYEIMKMSQHIYELSYFTPINDINIVYINNIINRLSPYFTDAFQKVLNGLKLCNPNSSNAYLPLQLIFTKMFKYNKTDVNLGILDGVAKIFVLIKDRPTIEIIVIVLAVAFIASKIFDMFRVKVEV